MPSDAYFFIFWIHSVSGLSVLYDPQLQIMCCYIARYYVKKMRVRVVVTKHILSLSWGVELIRYFFHTNLTAHTVCVPSVIYAHPS